MAKQHYVHSDMPLASMVTALEIGASRFCRERQLRAALTELAAANARVKELEAALYLVIQHDALNRGSSAIYRSITRIASAALAKGAA